MISKSEHNLDENHTENERTLDYVKTLWGNSATLDADPGLSLKSGSTVSEKSISKLANVKRRHIVQDGEDSSEADYELSRPLGEGGMGVVFRARQIDIDRMVALKLLKAEAAAKPENREKFVAEAMVTGNLDHPNIVPLYDLGLTENEELFYTMKELRGDNWRNSLPDLNENENLDILLKVCDAVAFAHSRGVIHRDLKPENIMLGDFGEVVVTDWGLAASVGHGLGDEKAEILNASSGSAGTSCYMPPEMALCQYDKIGPKSDVYLLGGLLYETITGLKPHGGENILQCLHQAMTNQIQETEKSGELIDIAMKAMSKDPEDRFQNVGSLQKAIRESREHSESLILTSQAEKDLSEAEKNGDYDLFNRSRFALEEALKLWSENRKAEDTLKSTLLAHAIVANIKHDYDLALSLLDSNVSEHREFRMKVESERKRWLKRQSQGKIFRRIAIGLGLLLLVILTVASIWIYMERLEALSQRDQAVLARKKAELQEEIANKERSNALEQEKIAKEEKNKAIEQEKIAKNEAKRAKAISDFLTGTLAQADPSGKGGKDITVLQVIEKMSKKINKNFKNDPRTSLNLHNTLGRVFKELGIYDEAKRHLVESKKLAESLFGKKHSKYIESLHNLAELLVFQGKDSEAKILLEEALEKISQSRKINHSLHYRILITLGNTFINRRKFDKSEMFYKKALEIIKLNKLENNTNKTAILNNLAAVYFYKSEFIKAGEAIEKILEIYKKSFGKRHPKYAHSLNNLASIYMCQGKHHKAELLYREALETQKTLLGENHPEYANSINNLACFYMRLGNYSMSESLFLQALEIQRKVLGVNHPAYVRSLNNLSDSYFAQGKNKEAEKFCRQAMETQKKLLGKKHPSYAESLCRMAKIHKKHENYSKGELFLNEAMKIQEKTFGKNHLAYAKSLNQLAEIYSDQGKFDRAEPLFQKSLKIVEKNKGVNSPTCTNILYNMMKHYSNMKRYEDAISIGEKALSICTKTVGKDHPNSKQVTEKLEMIRRKLNELKE